MLVKVRKVRESLRLNTAQVDAMWRCQREWGIYCSVSDCS